MPYLRPIATITEDTITCGFDKDGAGVHNVIGSQYYPYTHYLMTGTSYNNCCHSNLTRAALAARLKESDVGVCIEFLAETDLIVGASACPKGDVSLVCGGGREPVVHPLGVEVYKPEEGWLERCGWSPLEVNGYGRNHGL
ncbi:hypothetical protein ACHAWF_015162 [Thalassiosira exigua]